MTSKKQDNKRRAAISAGVLMSISGAAGETGADLVVNREVGPATGRSYDLTFDTVTSATDLVSISEGSVYTGEGYSLTISAIKTDDQIVELYDHGGTMSPFQTLQLSALTSDNFTEFAESDVKGLRIETPATFGGGVLPSVTIPAATVLAFLAVPEPGAALLLVLGFAALASRRVRGSGRREP